jgi:hypothetical protein
VEVEQIIVILRLLRTGGFEAGEWLVEKGHYRHAKVVREEISKDSKDKKQVKR